MIHSVREMRPSDFHDMIVLGRHAHAESAFSVYDWDEARLHDVLTICDNADNMLGLVVTDNNVIIGYMLAMIDQMFFGNDLAAYDITVYVKPSHRGTMAAVRMIKKYIQWAKANNAAVCCLGCGTMVNESRTAKFYNRLGFDTCGTQHKMVL